jgi:hypothetical protein
MIKNQEMKKHRKRNTLGDGELEETTLLVILLLKTLAGFVNNGGE